MNDTKKRDFDFLIRLVDMYIKCSVREKLVFKLMNTDQDICSSYSTIYTECLSILIQDFMDRFDLDMKFTEEFIEDIELQLMESDMESISPDTYKKLEDRIWGK